MAGAKIKTFSSIAGAMLVTFAAATVGTLASVNAADYYRSLRLPDWAPPAWLFGPVWTVLYLMMAVAAGLAIAKAGPERQQAAAGLFGAQLALNALWSWVFFAWQQLGWALAEIVLLLALIIANIVTFWKIRPVAGILMVPYALWVSFATALNAAIFLLNRGS